MHSPLRRHGTPGCSAPHMFVAVIGLQAAVHPIAQLWCNPLARSHAKHIMCPLPLPLCCMASAIVLSCSKTPALPAGAAASNC